MPSVASLARMRPALVVEDQRFYGCLTWAVPVLVSTIGSGRTARFVSWFDELIGVRRSAFRFVLVATRPEGFGIGAAVGVTSGPRPAASLAGSATETRLHFVRFDRDGVVGTPRLDREALIHAIATKLPPTLIAGLEGTVFGGKGTSMTVRERLLLLWFALNNVAGVAKVICIRDRHGRLIHRSTLVSRDLRKDYLNGGLEVTQVWTDPGFRGAGVASMVLSAVAEVFKGIKIHWVVRASNASSIAVAKRCGFVYNGSFRVIRRFGVSRYRR
jgi:GNAT superfamily N-acetyltransferase